VGAIIAKNTARQLYNACSVINSPKSYTGISFCSTHIINHCANGTPFYAPHNIKKNKQEIILSRISDSKVENKVKMLGFCIISTWLD
jgi:hypothetical protein